MPVQEWEAKKAYLFRPKYLMGIESVDRQHEELFRIIGEVRSIAWPRRSSLRTRKSGLKKILKDI